MTEQGMDDLGPEVPEEDALEQRTAVREPEPVDDPAGDPDSADAADLAEQARSVDAEDDEYR